MSARPDRTRVLDVKRPILDLLVAIDPAGVGAEQATAEYEHLAAQIAFRATGTSIDDAVVWIARELEGGWGFSTLDAERLGNQVRLTLEREVRL